MRLPVLAWLLIASIWGSTWLFIKVGLEDLPPFTFAGIRFLLASVPLAAWWIVRAPLRARDRIRGRDWRLVVVTGLLTFAVNYGLVF